MVRSVFYSNSHKWWVHFITSQFNFSGFFFVISISLLFDWIGYTQISVDFFFARAYEFIGNPFYGINHVKKYGFRRWSRRNIYILGYYSCRKDRQKIFLFILLFFFCYLLYNYHPMPYVSTPTFLTFFSCIEFKNSNTYNFHRR